ncbi:MAG: type II toxin-antitoxin system MqsA family antitoxin [Caldilineales bacterium]|nr:type II toxin-antitoxin system MqsA family antitoxin [Caldilineales bacterium]
MKDDLFDELVKSVREGGAILRGEVEPARVFAVAPSDVKSVRARFDLTQQEFAALLGVSVKTLQNWEQGRRAPHGPARVLLQVAEKHPEVVWDVVSAQRAATRITYNISPPPVQAFHEDEPGNLEWEE